MDPLSILYLMEDTDLSGGVRVQLAHADALLERGHHVSIATRGLPLRWRHSRADWIYVEDFRTIEASQFDWVVATFWTTLAPAHEIAPGRAIHLCQGYEGDFDAYQNIRPAIESAYSLPLPRFTVSPHLNARLGDFGTEVTWIGQVVDDEFYRERRRSETTPPRVALIGASQIDFKGIDIGYGAVQHARWQGAELDLIRVSPWAPAADEPRELAAEFHVGLDAHQMVSTLHSCDYLIGPSRRNEGFGLPPAEAMASRIPVVLSRIPSFLSFDITHDYALFAGEGDAEEMGDQLLKLLEDGTLASRLANRGAEVAEQWRSWHVAERIEGWMLQRRKR